MGLPFIGKKPGGTAGWQAVNVYPGRIDVVRVRQITDNLPQVETFASFERGDVLAQDLLRLGKALGGAYRCTTLLLPGDYQLVQTEAPAGVAVDEVKEAVRWQIKDALGFPVEDASLDVFTVPGAPGRPGQLYAVAANNSALRPLMLAFAEAKLDLAVVDIPEMAQRNLAILCEKPGRGVAFFSLSDEGGLLTFSGGGDLYASRRIEVSLASLRQADGERRAQLYERVVLEIQRTLDTFDRQFGHLPIDRLYLGPLPGAEELQKELAESVYVPVENFALSNVMDLSLQPDLLRPEVQASALLAIGAALRPFSS
jgi:Tfp pilus assembly protein, ATPase PilM